MRKSFIEIIKTIFVSLLILLSSTQYCYADVNVTELAGTLNGIGQKQINQTNKPQFSDRNNSSEAIDPVTGSLTLKQTDITLPGKDGLDLSIARIYNSSQAEYGTKRVRFDVSETSSVVTSKDMYFANLYYYDTNGIYHYGYRGPYSTWDEANNNLNLMIIAAAANNYTIDDCEVGLVPSGTEVWSDRTVTAISYPDKYNYLRARYDLGEGWAFAFPSVQIENILGKQYIYFHDGNGGVYNAKFSTSSSLTATLEDYQGGGGQFKRDSTYLSQDNVRSAYKFIDADKKTSYFAPDGRLLGIKDRLANEIKFKYTNTTLYKTPFPDDGKNGVYPLISQITDSIGRTIDFQYTYESNDSTLGAGEINLTINDPTKTKSLSMSYYKSRFIENYTDYTNGFKETRNSPILYSVLDTEGRTTSYEDYYVYHDGYSALENFNFSKKDIWMPISDPANTYYHLIQAVTYPCSKTYYKHECITRNLGESGAYYAYRVTERYDQERRYDSSTNSWIYSGDINHLNYAYVGDCTGYGSTNPGGSRIDCEEEMASTYQFSSEATVNANGLKTKTINNYKMQQIEVDTVASNGEKKVIKNLEFSSTYKFKPTKTEISEYAADGTLKRQLYVCNTYTTWGGLETTTQPLTATQLSDANTKKLYTTTYSYTNAAYPYFLTKKQWYQNPTTLLTESYTYDTNGNIKTYTNPKNEVTTYNYTYNTINNVIVASPVEITKTLENNKTAKTISYYGAGANYAFPTIIESYYTNDQNVYTKSTTTNTYNLLLGLVETVTDNSNHITTYQYDNIGRPEVVKLPDYVDVSGVAYSVEQDNVYYDSVYYAGYVDDGNKGLISKKIYSTTKYTNKTNNTYVRYNRIESVYDGFGNLRQETKYDSSTGQWVAKSRYLYDNLERVTTAYDAEGNGSTCSYDAWGNQNEVVDSYGNLYRTEFSWYEANKRKTSNYL